ncbi:chemotaxis protein CheB [Variovorax ureilyticus]|uniref:protein-glutamate methylesterase n=1 Tax=Variovorax ureilyticus TaxID=1836198 RepID=A0ABU8VB92_9BURK
MQGRIIVIGASFNGISALTELMRALPSRVPAAILVVQHTAPSGPWFLPEILSRAGTLRAVHPLDFELIEPGFVYAAPPATEEHSCTVRHREAARLIPTVW